MFYNITNIRMSILKYLRDLDKVSHLYHKKFDGRVCYILEFLLTDYSKSHCTHKLLKNNIIKIGYTDGLFPRYCPISGYKEGRILQLEKELYRNFYPLKIHVVFKERSDQAIIKSFEQILLRETKYYRVQPLYRYRTEYRSAYHIEDILKKAIILQKKYCKYINIIQ